jgi:hypothetical protein
MSNSRLRKLTVAGMLLVAPIALRAQNSPSADPAPAAQTAQMASINTNSTTLCTHTPDHYAGFVVESNNDRFIEPNNVNDKKISEPSACTNEILRRAKVITDNAQALFIEYSRTTEDKNRFMAIEAGVGMSSVSIVNKGYMLNSTYEIRVSVSTGSSGDVTEIIYENPIVHYDGVAEFYYKRETIDGKSTFHSDRETEMGWQNAFDALYDKAMAVSKLKNKE